MKVIKDRIKNGRRRLLYWAAGTLSALVLWRFKKMEKKDEPVKMLTEDGQLVEVDPRHLNSKGQKIRPADLYTWVKRKK